MNTDYEACPDAGLVRASFAYDPLTGNLHRVVYPRRPEARAIGGRECHGYRRIKLDGRQYRTHLLVWVWHHGTPPPAGLTIDHKNRIRHDNRIENLRLATPMEQGANTSRSVGRDLPVGVSRRRRKFRSQIGRQHLGTFSTVEEALAAREAALQSQLAS